MLRHCFFQPMRSRVPAAFAASLHGTPGSRRPVHVQDKAGDDGHDEPKPTPNTAALNVTRGGPAESNAPQSKSGSGSKRRPVIVRMATEEDTEAVVEFEQSLAQETEGKRLNDACIRRGVVVPLRSPHLARVYVATAEDDPKKYAGFITIGTQWSEWRGGFMHWVLSTAVHPDFRGTGVFTQIYRYVQSTIIADRLSVGLRLYVEKENIGAQKTYQKLGMDIEDYAMFKWMKSDSELPANQSKEVPFPGEGHVMPESFPTGLPWTIRLAACRDLDTLVKMQIANCREQQRPELKREDLRRGLAMPWAEPDIARIYVAEMDSKVVGMLMVTNEWSEWRGGIVYWLTSLYVRPDYRHKGICKSLFQFAKGQTEREPNAVGLRMQARTSNEYARKLATGIGLTEEPYYLMRWMDPQGALISRMTPITDDEHHH
jgi:GNAT superfamily N-acetyltransferase